MYSPSPSAADSVYLQASHRVTPTIALTPYYVDTPAKTDQDEMSSPNFPFNQSNATKEQRRNAIINTAVIQAKHSTSAPLKTKTTWKKFPSTLSTLQRVSDKLQEYVDTLVEPFELQSVSESSLLWRRCNSLDEMYSNNSLSTSSFYTGVEFSKANMALKSPDYFQN